MKFLKYATAISLCSFLGACDYNTEKDYNPKADFKTYQDAELEKTSAAAATGEDADPAALAAAEAKKNFGLFCVSCHGVDGKANAGAALAMNPKPRDLTDASWQDSVDDAHIAKVIEDGGVAVGLSVTMPAWGASLSPEQVQGLVAYIRAMKGA